MPADQDIDQPVKGNETLVGMRNVSGAIYGGMCDLVNGTVSTREMIVDLKFAALFYKEIIIPDTFFHAYGPIHSYLSGHVLARASTGRPDIFQEFLTHGVIAVALRKGDSLYQNWNQGTMGITPGEYLIVRRGEAEGVLRYVDRHKTKVMLWPETIASAEATDFGETLYSFLVSPDSPCVLPGPEEGRHVPAHLRAEWTRAMKLREDFCSTVAANRSVGGFRRGDVERIVARHMGLEFSSYQSAIERIDVTSPLLDPVATYGNLILTASSTVYQAVHAKHFGVAGGLFPLHDHPLIEAGLHDELSNLLDCGIQEREREPIAWGSLNVEELTAQQIVEMRRLDEFKRHCELLGQIRPPSREETFEQANPEFVSNIKNYVEAIIRKLPKMGRFEESLTDAADAGELLSIVFYPFATAINLGLYPIAVLLTGGAFSLRKSAPWIRNFAEYMRGKYRMARFQRMNNYNCLTNL